MKSWFLALMLLAFSSSAVAQETPPPPKQKQRGDASGYSSRDATVFSVMGWGIALGVGIATLCALLDNNTGSSHTH